jgi:BirA family biotin operon repressor/biotin-[acetyl-CoA-carboxylase] ligase
MKMITGKEYDLEECLNEISSCLDRRYMFVRTGEFSRIKQDYISKLYRFGQWSGFRIKSGIFEGRITDIMNDGKLIVEKRSGEKSGYYFREIEFIS